MISPLSSNKTLNQVSPLSRTTHLISGVRPKEKVTRAPKAKAGKSGKIGKNGKKAKDAIDAISAKTQNLLQFG